MHFPRFWARGSSDGFTCWRWSDTSESDAQQSGDAAVARVAAAFAGGAALDRYGYGDRPMREMVLEEVRDPGGRVSAVLTCNAYGATVLNAANALFVDVDLPESKGQTRAMPASGEKPAGFFSRLFGQSPRAEPVGVPPALSAGSGESAALARAESWAAAHPGWGWRVYRTRAGLRLLATHDVFEPDAPIVEQVFDAMQADPLYRRLCRAQKCFRARLSPKPWRCGRFSRPPAWPFANERMAARFDQWHQSYSAAAGHFATCALVKTIGAPAMHTGLREIIRLHDERTRVSAALPLA